MDTLNRLKQSVTAKLGSSFTKDFTIGNIVISVSVYNEKSSKGKHTIFSYTVNDSGKEATEKFYLPYNEDLYKNAIKRINGAITQLIDKRKDLILKAQNLAIKDVKEYINRIGFKRTTPYSADELDKALVLLKNPKNSEDSQFQNDIKEFISLYKKHPNSPNIKKMAKHLENFFDAYWDSLGKNSRNAYSVILQMPNYKLWIKN